VSFHPSIAIAKAKVQPVVQPVGPLPSEHQSQSFVKVMWEALSSGWQHSVQMNPYVRELSVDTCFAIQP